MPRLKKVFKKYERHFLLGLVILLLATFSITGATRCRNQGGPGSESQEMGGSFKVSPSDRMEIDDDDFDDLMRKYSVYLMSFGRLPVPSAEFAAYTAGMGSPEQVPATWMHELLLHAAEHAGYEAGEHQINKAIEDLVGFILMVQARVPYTEAAFQRFLTDNYRGSPASFRERVREVVLKDEFVFPLVTSARYIETYDMAYEAWKTSRERVDLRYLALAAAPFADLVSKEEETRRVIAERLDLAHKTVSVAGTVHRVYERIEKVKKDTGAYPASLEELEKKQGFKAIPDAWGKPLHYEVEGEKVDVRSAGPDTELDTDDDITIETQRLLESHGALYTVAQKLVQRHKSAGEWPKELKALLEPDKSGRLPGLASMVDDGWGHGLVYTPPAEKDGSATLVSLGADGEKGGGDDLTVTVGPEEAHVPAMGSLAARLVPAEPDAWGHAFHVRVKSAQPDVVWTVVSDGADGKPGTADDLDTGNAGEIRTFFGPIRGDYKEPARREFETLFVHLPLVTDAALKRLWDAFPEQRPTDEEELYRYWRSYKGEQFFYRADDPGDPDKGHGAKLAKDVAPEAAAVLVPSKDIFPADLGKGAGEPKKDEPKKDEPKKDEPKKDEPKKDEPENDEGKDAKKGGDEVDADRKTYREKGWREIVIRERFLENVLNSLLQEVRESSAAVTKAREQLAGWERQKKARDTEIAAWDEQYAEHPEKAPSPRPKPFDAKKPEVPAEITFKSLIDGKLADLVASGDEKTPPAIQYWKTPKPMTREEYEAVKDFGDGLQFELGRLKTDGAYNTIPAQLHHRNTKVLVRRLSFTPERQQTLDEVKDKVFSRFLTKREMDRAAEELGKLQKAIGAAEGKLDAKADDAARRKAFDDAVAAFDARVPGKVVVESTGLFIGSNPPPAVDIGDDTPADQKDMLARRNFVWRLGYEAVRPTGKDAEGKPAEVGAFGSRVLRDPVVEDEDSKTSQGTGCAYLVRVAAQAYPTKYELSPRRYLQYLSTRVFGDRRRRQSGERGSFLVALEHYFNDPKWMQTTFDLLTKRSLGVFTENRGKRRP